MNKRMNEWIERKMSWLESGVEKIRQSRESGVKKSLIKGPGAIGN